MSEDPEPHPTRRERLAPESALLELTDQIMSALHARLLRQEAVPSETVRRWLQEWYDTARAGLGEPPHFRRPDDGSPPPGT